MLKSYYRSLDRRARFEFAEAAGTSTGYIERLLSYPNLLTEAGRRGVKSDPVPEPGVTLIERFVAASAGDLSFAGVLFYFYPRLRADVVSDCKAKNKAILDGF